MEHEEVTISTETDATDASPLPVHLIRRNNRTLSVRRIRNRRLLGRAGTPFLHRHHRRRNVCLRYMRDVANTLIDSDWRCVLLAVSAGFIIMWLAFAGVWMAVATRLDNAPNNDTVACLQGIQGFAGFLLFSIETQTSIGYGTRFITDACPEAVLVLCVQVTTGVGVCGLLIGLVFEKLKASRRIHAGTCFSTIATVCQRDGQLCLVFRVRDKFARFQYQTQIRAYVVRKKGAEISLKSLKLEPVGILIWPLEVVHKITEDSPFWDLSARDLLLKTFEIIATMEGTSLSTCRTSLTTASYLSKEIRWGHLFRSCISFDSSRGTYLVDHKLFNSTQEAETPLCSAQRLRQVLNDISSSPRGSSSVSGEAEIAADRLLASLQEFLGGFRETAL